MKVYTKTGDTGETSLLGGSRVLKSDIQIEAYGTVDELNSYIGLARDLTVNQAIKTELTKIQNKLFTIGAHLASDQKKTAIKLPQLDPADIEFLENSIDKMEEILPPLTQFVLPGGHPTVSHVHISRSICRRAERCVINFNSISHNVNPQIIKYLNRLSDYLFVLGRFLCKALNCEEIYVSY
jgi:cob(I)alamin adenosyltransferase